MQILSKEEFLKQKQEMIKLIKSGNIFIYPTDTIYGIGCNAYNDTSVQKIRVLKQRPKNPFSIIAPNKKWIKNLCKLDETYLDKLPGRYTFVCKVKKNIISSFVAPGLNTLGVRIPNNWFTKIIEEGNVPFVTTSVNITGEKNMTSLEDMNDNIKKQVDYIIYEGVKTSSPSTIIDFTKEKVEVKKR